MSNLSLSLCKKDVCVNKKLAANLCVAWLVSGVKTRVNYAVLVSLSYSISLCEVSKTVRMMDKRGKLGPGHKLCIDSRR